MYKATIAAVVFALVSLAGAAHGADKAKSKFTLQSKDIQANQTIANAHVADAFGCKGENRSPELSWKGAPAGTKSFVLTMYDPDAPTGSGWWHWVVYDIPANVNHLPAGIGKDASLPASAKQAKTDAGTSNYFGPCPPVGDKPHRYVFTVYALKVEKLDVPNDASPALIGFMTNANKLGQARLRARYGR